MKAGSIVSRQVARPSPDLVGTVLPGVAENDNDDLRSLLRWVADQPERPNVEIVCAHENSPVAGRKDAILVRLEGCAAELSVASYLELAASGVAELRVLVLSCAMTERIEATIASANLLMSHCPGVSVITFEIRQQRRHGRGHAYDLRRLPVSRRRLLFLGHLDHSWVPDVQATQRAPSCDGIMPSESRIFSFRGNGRAVREFGSARRHFMLSLWRVREGMPDRGVASRPIAVRHRYIHIDLSTVAVH